MVGTDKTLKNKEKENDKEMKRTQSKTSYIRKRVKTVQRRAKFVGVLYLLGSLALAAAVLYFPLLNGTALGANDAVLPVLTFYKPIVDIFEGGFGCILGNLSSMNAVELGGVLSALFYVFLLLAVVFNALRSFKRLGWLFKRRASYTNGFNRNMYAMDSLGKRFSGSLAAIVIFYLLVYLASFDGTGYPTPTLYAYVVLGGGLALHFLLGLIGGKVTLFTMGENVSEELREFGLFTYFVRNLLQLAAIGGILYFLLKESLLAEGMPVMIGNALAGNVGALFNISLIIELVAWVCLFVMIKHATAATEFNRDCMDGRGMNNFRVFSFFFALAVGALVALPYFGVIAAVKTGLNVNLLIAAAISFVAFLLDCIVKSRHPKENLDDLGVEDYLRDGGEQKYNNTII